MERNRKTKAVKMYELATFSDTGSFPNISVLVVKAANNTLIKLRQIRIYGFIAHKFSTVCLKIP
jgi:hypothetical protein